MGIECPKISKGQFFKTVARGGGVAAGATAEFFVSGSGYTTHLATYSDEGLTSQNTNPVTADSDGRFGYIFLQNMPYGVEVRDADGYLIFSEDPVNRGRVRIKAAALPAVHWADLEVHLTTTDHLWVRNSDDSDWTDHGDIDGLGNASSAADVLTGTSTASFNTPDALAALWRENATPITAAASIAIGDGGLFTVNGATTTINTFGTATNGREIGVLFATAQSIANGSGIITGTGGTLYMPANSFGWFRKVGGTWYLKDTSQTGVRYGLLSRTAFTTPGANTWTLDKRTVAARMVAVGAGGGGAGSTSVGSQAGVASGGGSGGVAELLKTSSLAASYTVTIGTGGPGASTAADGTAGGNTTIGAILTANGGGGGKVVATGPGAIGIAGGTGGTASLGDTNINGADGQPAGRGASGAAGWYHYGGDGGHTPRGYGMGGRAGVTTGVNVQISGSNGTGYGSGGGGGSSNGSGGATASGGNGKDGLAIVEEYGFF